MLRCSALVYYLYGDLDQENISWVLGLHALRDGDEAAVVARAGELEHAALAHQLVAGVARAAADGALALARDAVRGAR